MKLLGTLSIQAARLVYCIIKLVTPVRDRVTCISRQSDAIPLDFDLLLPAIHEALPGWRVVMLPKKLRPGVAGALRYLPHMLRQMYYIAGSRVVVLDTYCIAISILKHRPGLKVLQIWHAVGVLKRTGKSVLGAAEGRDEAVASLMHMHENYDYMCASSDACIRGIAQVIGYDESRIAVRPLPRVDYLRDEAVKTDACERIQRALPELSQKKNILYVPTHRRAGNDSLQEKLVELAEAVDYTRYNLIVSPHPLSALKLERAGVFFPAGFTSLELAMYCDAAIIDYSSILYEIALIGKPMYFYTYDLDDYLTDPGFFVDFEGEVPGAKHRTAVGVMQDIAGEQYDEVAMQELLARYVDITEKNCTRALAAFIKDLGEAESGIKVGYY